MEKKGSVTVPVDINAVARDAIRLADLERDERIALRTSFFNPLPQVSGSPAQLVRAFVSLLVNARESLAGVGGGVIDVETEPDGDLVAIRILDNGPGMSQDLLERIFDPFDCAEAPRESGDGKEPPEIVGLSVACEILRDHSGTLTVRSRRGEGTCIVALIPTLRG